MTIAYRIAREDRADFAAALKRLSRERRRDGAHAWGAAEDTADPDTVLEWFFVSSWAEHLRQHRRVSKAAATLQAEATAFHRGPEPPEVHHFLPLDPRRGKADETAGSG